MDVFDLFNEQYSIVIDHYSKYMKLMSLNHDLTSNNTYYYKTKIHFLLVTEVFVYLYGTISKRSYACS